MSRFRNFTSSSDSDDEVVPASVQRGRVRQNQRFTEVKAEDIENAETADIKIPKKAKGAV